MQDIDPIWYKKKETYIEIIRFLLIAFFFTCIGIYMDDSKVAKECNDFIMENYWNESMLQCLREKGALDYPMPTWETYTFNVSKYE